MADHNVMLLLVVYVLILSLVAVTAADMFELRESKAALFETKAEESLIKMQIVAFYEIFFDNVSELLGWIHFGHKGIQLAVNKRIDKSCSKWSEELLKLDTTLKSTTELVKKTLRPTGEINMSKTIEKMSEEIRNGSDTNIELLQVLAKEITVTLEEVETLMVSFSDIIFKVVEVLRKVKTQSKTCYEYNKFPFIKRALEYSVTCLRRIKNALKNAQEWQNSFFGYKPEYEKVEEKQKPEELLPFMPKDLAFKKGSVTVCLSMWCFSFLFLVYFISFFLLSF